MSLEYLFWSTTLFHKVNDGFQISLLERKFQVYFLLAVIL